MIVVTGSIPTASEAINALQPALGKRATGNLAGGALSLPMGALRGSGLGCSICRAMKSGRHFWRFQSRPPRLLHISFPSGGSTVNTRLFLGTLALSLALGGCYHATVETGAKPSTVTLEKRWASGWIFGLVPPKTVETAAKCPSGVAKVETRIGFVNGLVSLLTLSIYTPMDIRITCAESPAGTAFTAPTTDPADLQAALMAAAEQSRLADGHPVYVSVTP
jgi:hypothetical protein